MDKRRIGVVLTLIAAVVLGVGTLSRTWWTSTSDDARVGLRVGEMCVQEHCNEMSLQKLVSGDLRFVRASTAAYWGGILACVLLLITGVARLRVGADTRRLSQVTLVAIGAAALAGVGAVAWFPRMGGMAAAYGMVVFFMGIALGAGASWYGLRRDAARETRLHNES